MSCPRIAISIDFETKFVPLVISIDRRREPLSFFVLKLLKVVHNKNTCIGSSWCACCIECCACAHGVMMTNFRRPGHYCLGLLTTICVCICPRNLEPSWPICCVKLPTGVFIYCVELVVTLLLMILHFLCCINGFTSLK